MERITETGARDEGVDRGVCGRGAGGGWLTQLKEN